MLGSSVTLAFGGVVAVAARNRIVGYIVAAALIAPGVVVYTRALLFEDDGWMRAHWTMARSLAIGLLVGATLAGAFVTLFFRSYDFSLVT